MEMGDDGRDVGGFLMLFLSLLMSAVFFVGGMFSRVPFVVLTENYFVRRDVAGNQFFAHPALVMRVTPHDRQ
jgi:hypothetical protein